MKSSVPTRHLTREIIHGFFEYEKELRTLTGKEHDAYRVAYQKEIMDYISPTIDFGPCEENGKWGIKHRCLGTFLIPPVYDEITDLDTEFSSHGYYKVKSEGRYGLATTSWHHGETVVPPLYDDILTWAEYTGNGAEPLDMSFIVRNGNKVGLVTDNKLTLNPEYDSFVYKTIGVVTEKEGKFGLYIKEKVIPTEYDDISIPPVLGWIKAYKDGVWGYFNHQWNFTTDIAQAFQLNDQSDNEVFDKPLLKRRFFEAFAEWMDDTPHVEGEYEHTLLDEVEFLNIDYLPDHDWPKPVFNRQRFFRTSKGVGLCHSLTGQAMIPATYDELWRNSPLGIYLFKKADKYGVVTLEGIEKCPPIYDEVKEVENLWWGVLVRKGNRWDYIDWATDRYPLQPIYDEIMVNDNGLLLKKDGKVGYYFEVWTYDYPLIPAVYDGIFIPEVAGWIRVCKDSVWGYLDKDNCFTTNPSEAFAYYES